MCSALRSGLDNLGVHAEEVPRNCLNPDCSGHCGHGCARGYKQASAAQCGAVPPSPCPLPSSLLVD